MKVKLFLESAAAHAKRIGLPKDRTKMLRRALTLKRAGYPPEALFVQMSANHTTWSVATSTPDELEHELRVVWEDDCYIPDDCAAPAQADTEQPGSQKLLVAQRGLYQDKQPPYGYLVDCEVSVKIIDRHVGSGYSLRPDLAKVSIVGDIFAQFIDGISPAEIAAGLNSCGVVSPEGQDWDDNQVRDIVHQAPLYAGFIAYPDGKHQSFHSTRILYAGRHAALIDLKTTLAVLAITGRTLQWAFGLTWETQAAATEVA